MTRLTALTRVAVAVVGLSGCTGSIDVKRAAHGQAVLEDLSVEAKTGPALAILVGTRGLHAIDPVTRTTVWRSPARATGHLSADADAIYVPAAGQLLRAIDRRSGRHRWTREIPGEAFVGVTAAQGLVVAATTGQRGQRPGQLVGLAAHDGHPLWTRRVDASPGVPAATERFVALPLGSQLVFLDRALGRELARIDLPSDDRWQRAEVIDAHLAVSSARAWLHLHQEQDPTRFDWDMVLPGYDTASADPGHDDGERLRWIPVAAREVDVVVQMRRAVLGLRTRQRGYDLVWLHLSEVGEEVVAAAGDADHVTLVSETGSLAQLRTEDGGLVWWWPRREPTVGALLVGRIHGRDHGEDELAQLDLASTPEEIRAGGHTSLRRLFADPDPRLDPLRRYVALATGYVPTSTTSNESDAVLAQGPDDTDPIDPQADLLAGDTPPERAASSVRVLCQRAESRDLDALLAFVRLHHADPLTWEESSAMSDATRCLLGASNRRREAVLELSRSPWTSRQFAALVDQLLSP